MYGEDDYRKEYRPFGHLGPIPLYVTTIIVLLECACVVVLMLLSPEQSDRLSSYFIFGSADVAMRFQFWRLVTYPFVNWLGLMFAVEMLFLYWFGRQVEGFIGRSAFAMLYVGFILVGSCVLTVLGALLRAQLILAGSSTVNLAVFIAFATIYPNAEIFFTLKAKWIAAILLTVDFLILIHARDFPGLLAYGCTNLAAFLCIKYLRGQIHFSIGDYFRFRRSRRNLRPLPRPRQQAEPRPKQSVPHDDVIESIDPLLDKIARHGIGSLTDREREKLEKARAELLKKPSP